MKKLKSNILFKKLPDVEKIQLESLVNEKGVEGAIEYLDPNKERLWNPDRDINMAKRHFKILKKLRPKKSKLQKKIDDPNSRLWRNKADKLWKTLVAEAYFGKCDLCGSTEYCQAHHLIPREMTSHRHEVINGILLCASHHKYSFEISPHKAPVTFFKWLMQNRQKKWEWLMIQEPSREHTVTFKEVYEKLSSQTNIT